MDLQAFLDDFLRTDDLDKLAADIHELLGCPVMIADAAFRVLAWHHSGSFDDGPFQGSIDRGRFNLEISSFLLNHEGPDENGVQYVTLEDSPYPRRFSSLRTNGVHVGYLNLVDVNGTLRDVPEKTLSTIESALAKQLRFKGSRESLLLTTDEAVLMHLLRGKFTSEPLFRLQAAAVGLANFAPARLALVNVELFHSKNWSDNALRAAITELLPGSRSLIYEGNILLLVHGEPDIAPLRVIARRFNLRIVVSSRFKNLYELPRIHAAAGEVMEFLLPMSRKPFAVSTGPFGTLMQLRRLAPRGDLVLPEVRALAERDAAEQSDYCLTLYTYLCCHHSLQQTCAALYAHRNTVLYRVRRMKQDFGIPLDDPKKHLTLVLSSALMLLEAGEDRMFVEEMWIE